MVMVWAYCSTDLINPFPLLNISTSAEPISTELFSNALNDAPSIDTCHLLTYLKIYNREKKRNMKRYMPHFNAQIMPEEAL